MNYYAYLKYRLINLPTAGQLFSSAETDVDFSRVAQKTFVGSKYIYAVLYFGIDATTVICRAEKPDDPSNNDVDFNFGADKMVLRHFGHTQTMEFFEHDDETYFWIGTKASAKNKKYHWSTQLARLQYSSGQNYSSNTEVQRISSIISATPDGSAHGSGVLERFDAALSDNGHLLIASQDTKGETCLTVYDNTEVNNALDGKSLISASSLTDCLAKTSGSNGFTTNLQNNFLPYDSVQGFEISNGNAIYITSGSAGSTPTVTKIAWNGENYETLKFRNNYWGGKNTETESPQIAGGNIYFTVSYHNGGDDEAVSANNIYYFDKKKFHING